MGDSFDDLADGAVVHGLLAHEVDILAAAVVVEVVKSVGVGESGFVHPESFGFGVHVVHELGVVEANAFQILCQIYASYF